MATTSNTTSTSGTRSMLQSRPRPPSPPRSPSPPPSFFSPPPSGQAEAAESWLSSSVGAASLMQSSPLSRASRKRSTAPCDHLPSDAPLPSYLTISDSPETDLTRPKRYNSRPPVGPNEPSFPPTTGGAGSSECEDACTPGWTPEFVDGSRWIVEEDTDGGGVSWTQERPKRKQTEVPRGLLSHSSAQNAETPANKKPKLDHTPPPKVLQKEQQDLVDLIETGRNVFYTGSAGCGKSTVLKATVERFRQKGKVVQVVAPTGLAALQVEGITTWSFMGWNLDTLKQPSKDLLDHTLKKRIRKRLKRVELLIIDEISMVENHILERMNTCMKHVRRSKHDSRTHGAFGGCQIVVTGDFCQLPPVEPFERCMECGAETKKNSCETGFNCTRCDEEYREHEKWAFCSDAWQECRFAHVGLRQIHRQDDPEFVRILQKCRVGKALTTEEMRLLMDHPCEVDKATHLYPTKKKVKAENDKKFAELPSLSIDYECLDYFKKKSQHENHDKWEQRLPNGTLMCLKDHKMDSQVQLKKDMLVILQVNLDLDAGLCNGSQGMIVGFERHDPNKLPQAGKTTDEAATSTRPPDSDRTWKNPEFVEAYAKAASKSTESGSSATLDRLLAGRPVLRGEDGQYREQQIQLFVKKQKQKSLVWPIVKFHNGPTRTIYPECMTNSVCYEPRAPSCITSRTQIPLLAGWAMTMHKSQGMTLDRVIVDIGKVFASGQIYVALSRVRTLKGLKIEGDPRKLLVGETIDSDVQDYLEQHELLDDDGDE